MKNAKGNKQCSNLIMPGDICVVGLTDKDRIVIYDRYTNSIRVVSKQLFDNLSKRNRIVNKSIDISRLSIYSDDIDHIIDDKGVYIIGKVALKSGDTRYRIFGSACKPLDISVETFEKYCKNCINAKIVDGEIKIEQ